MTMTRAFRRFVCRLLLGVLVFGQMAIAAYACPALSGAPQFLPMAAMDASIATMSDQKADAMTAVSHDASAMQVDSAMAAGCAQVDNSTPNLCAGHCSFGQQSADHTPAPSVPAAVPITLYTLPLSPEPLGHVRLLAGMKFKQVAAPPPHAILHCCFRI
jgi:hypothetical protein